MFSLQKTLEAEQDLIDIWLYSAEKWSEAQADKYLGMIDACFDSISQEQVPLKNLAENIYFVRCQHHYIFLLIEKKPIAIAVLHEKMDLLVCLKDRLR